MSNTFSRDDLSPAETQVDEELPADEAEDAADNIEHASTPTPVRLVVDDEDELLELGGEDRLPDIADPDVNFDVNKLREKTAAYVARQAKQAVAQLQTRTRINEKISQARKAHPDWEEVVDKNPVLAANQLAPDAAMSVARSKHTGELLYRFGKDPALAIRVAKLSPRHQVLEVANLIRDIEDEQRKTRAASTSRRRPGPARSGPPTREEQLSDRSDMQSFAAASRQRRFAGRFYK